MTCVCGCPQDEHSGKDESGPCDLSKTDKRHLCGAFEADEDSD